MTSTLGQRVRQIRTQLGLSQGEVGGDRVTASYLSLIESGKRIPGRDVLAGIADRLGTTVNYLENGTEPAEVISERLRQRAADLAAAEGNLGSACEQYRILTESPRAETANKALWSLAEAEEKRGEHETALHYLDALDRPSQEYEPGAPSRLALLIIRCRIYREAGDYARSSEVGEAGLREIAAGGLSGTEDEVRLAHALVRTYEARGDLVSARRLSERVVAAAEALGDPKALARAYWQAVITCESRDKLLALECAEKALAALASAHATDWLDSFRVTYAWLLLRLSPPHVEQANAHLRQAHAALVQRADKAAAASCETEMARAALIQGKPAEAIRLADRAITASIVARHIVEQQHATVVRGLALIASGEEAEGAAATAEAAAVLASQAPTEAAKAYRELGEAMLARGLADQAISALRKAADTAGARSAASAMPAAPRVVTTATCNANA